jgi:glycosyltransferase involved in cell wall biosynthesis
MDVRRVKRHTNECYRVGVDVSCLCEPLTGIGRYAFEIVSRIIQTRHTWFLYSPRRILQGGWESKNIEIREGNLPKRFFRMIWAQTFLPAQVKADKLDLFWSPVHRLPYLLPNNVAKVVSIHDLVWKHAPHTMRPLNQIMDRLCMPAAVRHADKVITVSESTRLDLIREVPNSEGKTSTIYLGSPGLASVLGEKKPAQDICEGPYFLFVGTLEPRKNLPALLRAYSRLALSTQRKAALFIVGGKGWGSAGIGNLLSELNIHERVHFLGYVNDDLLDQLYRHSLFLAMPSLYEGFGLPLLEAMARGIPVLTSNCSSMPEVVGDAGHLVDPTSVDSIRDGLKELIENHTYRNDLAMKSYVQAKKFDWDASARLTMTAFEKVIEGRRLGSPTPK